MKSFLLRFPGLFRREIGLSPAVWVAMSLLDFATMIVLHRELATGQFGTMNTVLGVVGLMTVPVLAVPQALAWYVARKHPDSRREQVEALQSSALHLTETLAWAWTGLGTLLLLLILAVLALPRFSLDLLALLGFWATAGAVVSCVVCADRLRLWSILLISAAVARLLIGAALGWELTWAESGLIALVVATCILLAPMLSQPATETAARLKAVRTAFDPDFLLYLGATFSVLLAVFLFGSADRIVAQSWFGSATNNNFNYVDWPAFDAYQTAGLLGRGLFWSTQPLLFLLFAQRSVLDRSTAASLTWFWIYLGLLIAGSVSLVFLSEPLSQLFCGTDFKATAKLVPIFAVAMIPLGLLQALAFFSLASRRYHECFVAGGCGLGYTLVLFLFGRRPEVMPVYMFAAGLVALMVVLFIGVVRWGRKQP